MGKGSGGEFGCLPQAIFVIVLLLFALKLLDMGAKGDITDALKMSSMVAYVQLMISLTLATFGLVTYILVSGFLLYFHGGYGGFHSGFFESFTVPPMVWPDLQLLTDIPNLASVWARVLTFDSNVPASAVINMILWVHTVCLILAKVSMFMWKVYR